ncbi:MAG: sigma-70 family RNA polymerase sigma factor [Muribaculaceae bacterium]|nr:sigma-70 family RNA polymerase sigma factor [Muribaculaceae bacterium]
MEQPQKEFERLVREYEKDIYAICYLYASCEEEAKDLRQDTLINIWNGLPKFRGESSLRTWITRLTINTCISFKRKKKPETVGEEFVPQLANPDLEATEQVKLLHRRLQRLEYLDRALVMLWLENMSYDEIGAILGIAPKNVGVRLVRIKEKLKKIDDNE